MLIEKGNNWVFLLLVIFYFFWFKNSCEMILEWNKNDVVNRWGKKFKLFSLILYMINFKLGEI